MTGPAEPRIPSDAMHSVRPASGVRRIVALLISISLTAVRCALDEYETTVRTRSQIDPRPLAITPQPHFYQLAEPQDARWRKRSPIRAVCN